MTPSRRTLSAATAMVATGSAAAAVVLTLSAGSPARGALVVAVSVAVYAGVGLLIAVSRPGHPVGRTLLAGATVWGLGEAVLAVGVHGLVIEPGSVPVAAWLALAGLLLRGVGWLLLVLVLPLRFPDGSSPSAPWRWAPPVALAALATYTAATLLSPTLLDARLDDVANPLHPSGLTRAVADGLAFLALVLVAAALAGAVGALIGRWRAGTPLVRQQLLWFTWAAAAPIVLIPFVAGGVADAVMFGIAVLPLPVAIGVAVLQHRLYDVQFAVNRTVAWAALSGTLAFVYVLVVAGIGALLDARGASWLPWLATGVVALSFAPLREALQRAANRLVYGRWAQPEEVLATVRARVADARDVHGLLQDLVRELGEGLGLAHVSVRDADGEELASYGAAAAPAREMPLLAYGRPVGVLRSDHGGRPLRESDRRLLDNIADQVGVLVYAAGLVVNLRAARERLVLSREDERRRLRRDLHDGLGSALAGLTFKVEAARNLLRHDPDAAEATLRELRSGIQAAVGDVRRVVDGLTPPSLEQLGLVGAVSELAERLGRELPGGIAIDVTPGLPPVSAAVEVATYRVAQEALTNVVRHAGASRCRVSLGHDGSSVRLDVADDGSGVLAHRPGGAGLPGMRERAEELGGEFGVEARPGSGTTIRLRLPAAGSALEPEMAAR